MVAGATRRLAKVPKFASLRDFLLAKKWYMRALFMPGPERSDSELRFRRHRVGERLQRIPTYM